MGTETKGKTFHLQGNDISDGYHTFDELYKHRCFLFLALCSDHNHQCCWKEDAGTPGWVIVYWESPNGQISYHVPEDMFAPLKGLIDQEQEHKWDGHNSADSIARLAAYLKR